MLGFVVGTACLIGLVKVVRGGRRCGYGHGHGHGHGWGGGCGGRAGRFGGYREYSGGDGFDVGEGSPVLLRALFERLQTSPGQEKVIREAFDELKGAARKIKDERRATVRDLADAVRGEDFGTEAMGNAFARLDGAVETLRTAAFSALAKVHDALDETQRKRLADLIARAGGASRFADDIFRG